MLKATASEVSKRFGQWYDEAMIEPVAIGRNGIVRVVMLSAVEYERLLRLDHISVTPRDLSNGAFRSLVVAEAGCGPAVENDFPSG